MVYKKVHFIGIGGVSLSGLATYLHSQGVEVSGSDCQNSPIIQKLKKNGIKVSLKHNKRNINNTDCVVYTDAIDTNNPELKMAKMLSIPLFKRAEFLCLLSKDFQNVIAVAGCHGKTTTTGLLHFALQELLPTSHIGGMVNGENFFVGNNKLFITEACEYKKNFLHLSPNILVILNIDKDHMDCYKNLQDLISTYQQLVNKIQNGGTLIINGDDKHCKKIKYDNKISFGLDSGNDFSAQNIKESSKEIEFDLFVYGDFNRHIKMQLGLRHNIYNILATYAVAYAMKAEKSFINISQFEGVERRNQFICERNGCKIFHDYAHHPQEIKKIIANHKKFCLGKLFVVFEAHTYSRTLMLQKEFNTCFLSANKVFVLPIYPAREKPIKNVTGKNLAKWVNGYYVRGYRCCKKTLLKEIHHGDELLILGAGSVYKLAESFLK